MIVPLWRRSGAARRTPCEEQERDDHNSETATHADRKRHRRMAVEGAAAHAIARAHMAGRVVEGGLLEVDTRVATGIYPLDLGLRAVCGRSAKKTGHTATLRGAATAIGISLRTAGTVGKRRTGRGPPHGAHRPRLRPSKARALRRQRRSDATSRAPNSALAAIERPPDWASGRLRGARGAAERCFERRQSGRPWGSLRAGMSTGSPCVDHNHGSGSQLRACAGRRESSAMSEGEHTRKTPHAPHLSGQPFKARTAGTPARGIMYTALSRL